MHFFAIEQVVPQPPPNSTISTKPGAQMRVGSFPLSFALGSLFLFAVMRGTKFFFGWICCCNWNIANGHGDFFFFYFFALFGFDLIKVLKQNIS